jgi:hypothetical protein
LLDSTVGFDASGVIDQSAVGIAARISDARIPHVRCGATTASSAALAASS